MGPIAIGETFCKPQYPEEGRRAIVEMLQQLQGVLEKGVKINQSLITDDQVKFQEALEKGFAIFQKKVQAIQAQNAAIRSDSQPTRMSVAKRHGTIRLKHDQALSLLAEAEAAADNVWKAPTTAAGRPTTAPGAAALGIRDGEKIVTRDRGMSFYHIFDKGPQLPASYAPLPLNEKKNQRNKENKDL